MSEVRFTIPNHSDRVISTSPPYTRRGVLQGKIWRVVLVAVTVIAVAGVTYPMLPPTYEAVALVLLQPTNQNGQPDFGYSTLNALDENEIQAYSDILASHRLLQTVIDKQHLMDNPEFNPTLRDTWYTRLRTWVHDALHDPPISPAGTVEIAVHKRLVIRRDRKSYVMQVGFWSRDSYTAAAMANTLAAAFVSDQLTRRQNAQRDIVASLTKRAVELMRNYLGSEERVNSYLMQSGLIHRDQHKSAEEQLAILSREYALATSQALAAEERAQTLSDMQRADTLDNAPDVLASPIIRDLKERLITLSSNTGTPGTFGIGSAMPKFLADLRQLINVEMQRIVRAAQSDATMSRERADVLRAQIAAIDAHTIAWDEAERPRLNLQREADADQKTLRDAMNQLRTQTNLIATLRPDAEIYATAVAPWRPAFPNPIFYAVASLLLAAVLSTLLLFPAFAEAQRTVYPRARQSVVTDS